MDLVKRRVPRDRRDGFIPYVGVNILEIYGDVFEPKDIPYVTNLFNFR